MTNSSYITGSASLTKRKTTGLALSDIFKGQPVTQPASQPASQPSIHPSSQPAVQPASQPASCLGAYWSILYMLQLPSLSLREGDLMEPITMIYPLTPRLSRPPVPPLGPLPGSSRLGITNCMSYLAHLYQDTKFRLHLDSKQKY